MADKVYRYKVKPEIAFDDANFKAFMQTKLGRGQAPNAFKLIKRSIDARARKVMVNIEVAVFHTAVEIPQLAYKSPDHHVDKAERVVIIGAGPAGLFAALKCIEMGVKPIVLERGKDVQERRRDLANINKEHIVNPDSNYCFGEGGAGTYSDGKLYTRSKKRGDITRILEILVTHGATDDILVDTHPHIGTNKLPKVIASMREAILEKGGEIHFNTRVTDFKIDSNIWKGVVAVSGEVYEGIGVILATGHSARDIFELLDKKKILIEPKPFALGVRIEHPQQLIDKIQYHCDSRGAYLPAAPYAMATQTEYQKAVRGVFSFCMCPGGFIVPSATNEGEVVVNGMSPSKRDSKFANSGMVVSVESSDFEPYQKFGALAGMKFQAEVEKKACIAAGNTQKAPAQRLVDYVSKQHSNTLPECSYQPGLESVNLEEVLPQEISERLKIGFRFFGKKMKGYLTNEAVLVGVESRTSSPVSIPRNRETMEHLQVERLFPCGEGAGYAGGIMSAAIDGEKCAEMLVMKYAKKSKA
ncbi:FAD-dependent oxidoreductase [Reichenbachiella sp. MALMAid0571]|uniref:NAD(P)/FAD-dependent oxidoreductase n=1 Tax=Reichenbachiella sp. MALMAid0571 TaxID=3143939 RepID=UPI0032DF8300